MEWTIQVSHHPWDIIAIESFLNLIMLEPLGPLKGAFSVEAQASCEKYVLKGHILSAGDA
jgi:hypothetical protein